MFKKIHGNPWHDFGGSEKSNFYFNKCQTEIQDDLVSCPSCRGKKIPILHHEREGRLRQPFAVPKYEVIDLYIYICREKKIYIYI